MFLVSNAAVMVTVIILVNFILPVIAIVFASEVLLQGY